MCKGEYLLLRADACTKKAIEFAMQGEHLVALFWYNAAEGFKMKAYKLTKKQAEEKI